MFQFWLPRSTVVTSHKLTKFAPNHPVPDMCVHDHIQIKNSSRGHATQMPRRKSCLQCNAQRTSFEGSNQAAQSKDPDSTAITINNFEFLALDSNSACGPNVTQLWLWRLGFIHTSSHRDRNRRLGYAKNSVREPQIPAFQFRLITISLVIG